MASRKAAERLLRRAREEIVPAAKRLLFGVTGSLAEGRIACKCRGSGGETYEVEAVFQDAEGMGVIDWADVTCTCPYFQGEGGRCSNAICKHTLALLLARLSRADWVAAGGDPEAAEAGAAAAPEAAAAPPAAAAAAAAPAASAAASAPAAAFPAAPGGGGGPAPKKRRLGLPAVFLLPT